MLSDECFNGHHRIPPFLQFGQQLFQNGNNPVVGIVQQDDIASLGFFQDFADDSPGRLVDGIVRAHAPSDDGVTTFFYRLGKMWRGNAVRGAEETGSHPNGMGNRLVCLPKFFQPFRLAVEIDGWGVSEGMIAHQVPLFVGMPYQAGMLRRVPADAEKRSLDAVCLEQRQHVGCKGRMRPIVKGER